MWGGCRTPSNVCCIKTLTDLLTFAFAFMFHIDCLVAVCQPLIKLLLTYLLITALSLWRFGLALPQWKILVRPLKSHLQMSNKGHPQLNLCSIWTVHSITFPDNMKMIVHHTLLAFDHFWCVNRSVLETNRNFLVVCCSNFNKSTMTEDSGLILQQTSSLYKFCTYLLTYLQWTVGHGTWKQLQKYAVVVTYFLEAVTLQ